MIKNLHLKTFEQIFTQEAVEQKMWQTSQMVQLSQQHQFCMTIIPKMLLKVQNMNGILKINLLRASYMISKPRSPSAMLASCLEKTTQRETCKETVLNHGPLMDLMMGQIGRTCCTFRQRFHALKTSGFNRPSPYRNHLECTGYVYSKFQADPRGTDLLFCVTFRCLRPHQSYPQFQQFPRYQLFLQPPQIHHQCPLCQQ